MPLAPRPIFARSAVQIARCPVASDADIAMAATNAMADQDVALLRLQHAFRCAESARSMWCFGIGVDRRNDIRLSGGEAIEALGGRDKPSPGACARHSGDAVTAAHGNSEFQSFLARWRRPALLNPPAMTA